MDYEGPPTTDIENLMRDMTPEFIMRIKEQIKTLVSTWLFGLEKPIERRVESLFVLQSYSDKISGTKRLGQAHVLFRGLTGIGKTDLEQSIALSINAISKRIQGDPEMMPRHVTGGSKFVESLSGERKVVFEPGPLLAHLVLVDEANRMRQNTFAAVIEAMEERSITPKNEYVDERDRAIRTLPFFPITGKYDDFESPRFFQVALTENPFGDEEGNYPNPQALLDRITLSISIERPNFTDEKKIRAKNVVGKSIKPVTNLAELLACAQYIFNEVDLSPRASEYLTLLLRNSNPPDPNRPDIGKNSPPELTEFVKNHVQVGASPRVNFHLEAVARVRAFFSGSNIIKPEHVKEVASEVISHRLRLVPGMEFETTKEKVFAKILELTEIPPW